MTFANFRRHFCLSQLGGGGLLLASIGQRPGVLASAKHRMDSHTENCPIQNDNSAKVGKLYLRVWTEIIPSKEGLLIDRRGGLGLLKIPL